MFAKLYDRRSLIVPRTRLITFNEWTRYQFYQILWYWHNDTEISVFSNPILQEIV